MNINEMGKSTVKSGGILFITAVLAACGGGSSGDTSIGGG